LVTAQRVGPRSPPSSGPKPDLAGRPWTIPGREAHRLPLGDLASEPFRKPTIATLLTGSGGRRISVSNRRNPELRHRLREPHDLPARQRFALPSSGPAIGRYQTADQSQHRVMGDLRLKPLTGLLDSKVRQSLSPPPESVVELPASAMYLK